MKIIINDEWNEGYLDYYCNTGEVRIKVLALRNLETVNDQYFVRPVSLKIIWNYLHEIGLFELIKKVRSRLQEKKRNTKYVSVGYGEIIQSGSNVNVQIGQMAVFLATNHPASLERICVSAKYIRVIVREEYLAPIDNYIKYLRVRNDSATENEWWSPVTSYSSYSGLDVSDNELDYIMRAAESCVKNTDWDNSEKLSISGSNDISEIRPSKGSRKKNGRFSAVLYGYGHYAKTIIIPNADDYFNIETIHEIDPLQMPTNHHEIINWSTAPFRNEEETYDVHFVACYHQMHAQIASKAILEGAVAVVEKPVAVERNQVDLVIDAMKVGNGKLFSCFNRRYSPVNTMVREDMEIQNNEPISYHCIVYQEPLPKYHWYRWPNTRSRLVSNGCHWIDHFLYLNNFASVEYYDVYSTPTGEITCNVTLENGAMFTMAMSDKGANRIGVQEYIELRKDNVTVKITNNTFYQSENNEGIMRRCKLNKMNVYRNMYKTICGKIVEGAEGDTVRSIEVSARLIVALEDKLNTRVTA